MKGKKIFEALTNVDDKYIEEARRTKLKKPSSWKKWTAIAASLVLMVSIGGILIKNNMLPIGGSSGGGGHDGGSSFMSYAGPVFSLILAEEDNGIRAEREITFDFPFPSEESIRIWGSEVEDSYILSNPSIDEKRLTVLYPFTGSFNRLGPLIPEIVIDGTSIDPKLYPGGDFANSSYLLDSDSRGNGFQISGWEGYKSLLEDGSYKRDALSPSPSLDQDVIVYSFTDFESPDEYDAASQAIFFNIDTEKTRVLTYGFNGAEFHEDGFRRFSYFVPKEDHAAKDSAKVLVVIGDDIGDYSLQGYKTGACEEGNELEGVSATITKSEENLNDLMGFLINDFLDLYYDEDGLYRVDDEMFFGAFSELVNKHNLFSLPETDNYNYTSIEDIISLTNYHDRVFYLGFEVNIPAGESIEITANMHKEPSHDYSGVKRANEGVQGYDMVTQLASNLIFDSQRAALASVENIKIVRQNFGFDLENGISQVELDMDMEHYYLEVKPLE